MNQSAYFSARNRELGRFTCAKSPSEPEVGNFARGLRNGLPSLPCSRRSGGGCLCLSLGKYKRRRWCAGVREVTKTEQGAHRFPRGIIFSFGNENTMRKKKQTRGPLTHEKRLA